MIEKPLKYSNKELSKRGDSSRPTIHNSPGLNEIQEVEHECSNPYTIKEPTKDMPGYTKNPSFNFKLTEIDEQSVSVSYSPFGFTYRVNILYIIAIKFP